MFTRTGQPKTPNNGCSEEPFTQPQTPSGDGADLTEISRVMAPIIGKNPMTSMLVSAYKQGMDVATIASEHRLPVEIVETIISAMVPAENSNKDCTEKVLVQLKLHAVDLALRAEDEGVQARMTSFLLERANPRSVRVESSGPNNVTFINQILSGAKERANELKQAFSRPQEAIELHGK